MYSLIGKVLDLKFNGLRFKSSYILFYLFNIQIDITEYVSSNYKFNSDELIFRLYKLHVLLTLIDASIINCNLN